MSEYPRSVSRCFPRSASVADLHEAAQQQARFADTSVRVHKAHWREIERLRRELDEVKADRASEALERARAKGASDRTVVLAFAVFGALTTLAQIAIAVWKG